MDLGIYVAYILLWIHLDISYTKFSKQVRIKITYLPAFCCQHVTPPGGSNLSKARKGKESSK
jgi:hypothetical protein